MPLNFCPVAENFWPVPENCAAMSVGSPEFSAVYAAWMSLKRRRS